MVDQQVAKYPSQSMASWEESVLAKIMDLCCKALINVSWKSSSQREYGLWLGLISLANKLYIAFAIAKNRMLQDLIRIIQGDQTVNAKSFVESGLVTEKYKIDKDNLPSVIEGRNEEEILKALRKYLTCFSEVRSEVKNYIEKLLDSPVKIQLDILPKENVIAKLVKCGLCELYLVPKGYPIDKLLWFTSPRYISRQSNLSKANNLIYEMLQQTEELPEIFKKYLEPQIKSLIDIYKHFEEAEVKTSVNQEIYYCSDCYKEISKEDYIRYKGRCRKCFIRDARRSGLFGTDRASTW